MRDSSDSAIVCRSDFSPSTGKQEIQVIAQQAFTVGIVSQAFIVNFY
ncbi:hypothetical protein [Colwellia chukchiensis]|nr:hypothetical protein [Colwellia chukchiensis]